MKRNVLLLTAIALISTTSTGCGCCSWLWPKSATPIAAQPVSAQYAPACDTCGDCCGYGADCGTYGYGAPAGTTYPAQGTYDGGTMVMPEPGGY